MRFLMTFLKLLKASLGLFLALHSLKFFKNVFYSEFYEKFISIIEIYFDLSSASYRNITSNFSPASTPLPPLDNLLFFN